MKSFIVLFCGLAVASASPVGYWKDWSVLTDALNYEPPANAQAVKAKPGYPSGLYPGPAPVVAPVRSSDENVINVAEPVAETAPVNLFDWKSLIGMGGSALSKASDSLNEMMKGLQGALNNINPSLKSDVGKVNKIVDDVCNKIVEYGSESPTFTYYSPEGLKVTCDYINRVAKVIVDGLENPEVTQYYVDKLNAPTKALLEQVEIYSA
jgi:hypothetical protein